MVSAAEIKQSLRLWLDSADRTGRRLLPGATLAALVALFALPGHALAASKDGWSGGQAPTMDEPAPAQPQIRYEQPGPHVVPRHSEVSLDRNMVFELAAGGRLLATGTIVPGTADRFADEVRRRGISIKTVVLYSPGGSVRDAIAMGRLIRDKKYATEVEEGRSCASACPLIFAGGVTRRAGAGASIGVHQVSSFSNDRMTHDDGMASAQQVTAITEGYLRDMGVDLEVWLHALATSKDDLYIFTPKELLDLKLATEASTERSARTQPKEEADEPHPSYTPPPGGGGAAATGVARNAAQAGNARSSDAANGRQEP
jgi:hypothetical protein